MRLGVFIRAVRLPFLTGSLMPVALVAALAIFRGAWGGFFYFFLTVVGVAGLHTGGNLLRVIRVCLDKNHSRQIRRCRGVSKSNRRCRTHLSYPR
ncbi:MAG: hypothetical protein P8X49_10935, partial [Syntrophobacterales bacterium]